MIHQTPRKFSFNASFRTILHEFEFERPSNKGIKLLFKEVIKTIINRHYHVPRRSGVNTQIHAHLCVDYAQNDDSRNDDFIDSNKQNDLQNTLRILKLVFFFIQSCYVLRFRRACAACRYSLTVKTSGNMC